MSMPKPGALLLMLLVLGAAFYVLFVLEPAKKPVPPAAPAAVAAPAEPVAAAPAPVQTDARKKCEETLRANALKQGADPVQYVANNQAWVDGCEKEAKQ